MIPIGFCRTFFAEICAVDRIECNYFLNASLIETKLYAPIYTLLTTNVSAWDWPVVLW